MVKVRLIGRILLYSTLLIISLYLYLHAKGYLEYSITLASVEIGLASIIFIYSITKFQDIIKKIIR